MGAIQRKLGFVQEDMLSLVVQRMSEGPIPLAHWTGYTAIVLVASACIRKWTVTISDSQEEEAESTSEPPQKSIVFPRRWLDIYGRKLADMWESALRAVLGLVLLHPGVSQVRCISIPCTFPGLILPRRLVYRRLRLRGLIPDIHRQRSGGGCDLRTIGKRWARCCRRCSTRDTSLHTWIRRMSSRVVRSGVHFRTSRRRSTRSGSWGMRGVRAGGVGTRCKSFPRSCYRRLYDYDDLCLYRSRCGECRRICCGSKSNAQKSNSDADQREITSASRVRMIVSLSSCKAEVGELELAKDISCASPLDSWIRANLPSYHIV